MSDLLLRVKNLTKRYEKFTLDQVSFDIPKGFIMGFSGQNGSGKSTTIKCMMDLIRYESGTIEYFGQPGKDLDGKWKERIGYVSEEPCFYEDMSVEWSGQFIGSFYKKWDKARFQSLLNRFQVDPRKKVKELSKGMKMKLSLALAMSHHPELLILDEPTSGLDPIIRSELLEVFLEIIQNEGCSIFFSSHISTDIEKVADFITVIHNGKVVVSTDKHTLLDEWKLVKVDNRFRDPGLMNSLVGCKENEFGFSGLTKNPREFDREWRRRFPEDSYKAERLSLDELLIRIVKEEERRCVN